LNAHGIGYGSLPTLTLRSMSKSTLNHLNIPTKKQEL
jgi:hypothetical protein